MIFNLDVHFNGIYKYMFNNDTLTLKVTFCNNVWRVFVLTSDNLLVSFESWYAENLRKYDVTKHHIEKLKKHNVTSLDGSPIDINMEDFSGDEVAINPLREIYYFVSENIVGNITYFTDFIENTVKTQFATAEYMTFVFSDIDTSYAKIVECSVRQVANKEYSCDIRCVAKLKNSNKDYVYAILNKKDYIRSKNIVLPEPEFTKIGSLFGKYIDIDTSFAVETEIAFNDIDIFDKYNFIKKLEDCKVIVDKVTGNILPLRILIDVCSTKCPIDKIKEDNVIYAISLLTVQNSIINTYGVYVRSSLIKKVFEVLRNDNK